MNIPLPPTMRAALCDGPGAPLRIARVPVPRPGPGQYLVRVEACGICHSDLHLQRGDESLPASAYPLILGHEGIGRIVEGEGPLPIGARVGLPWLYDTCLCCDPCLTGHENFCKDQRARGIGTNGAFAEFALIETRFAIALPDEIDTITGGPLLCAGLTAWTALAKCRVLPGKRLLVIGAGGLGQYAVDIALARGLRVAVVDTDPEKRAMMLQRGAELAADGTDPAPILAWGGADITLNFAPSPKVWPLIAACANPLSDVVAIALVQEPVPLSMMWLINGGHRVFGSSVGTRADQRAFLEFARTRSFGVGIETVPLDEADTALQRLAAGKVLGRLVIDMALPAAAGA